MITIGQRLIRAISKIIQRKGDPITPAWLAVIRFYNLIDVFIFFWPLVDMRDYQMLAIRSDIPCVVGKVVSKKSLLPVRNRHLYELFLTLVIRARKIRSSELG